MIATDRGPRWVSWTERPVASYDRPARRFYVLRCWEPYDPMRHVLTTTQDGALIGAMFSAVGFAPEPHDVLRAALGDAYLAWAEQGFVDYQFAGATLEVYADFPIDFPPEFFAI